jgi:hypothetical protein
MIIQINTENTWNDNRLSVIEQHDGIDNSSILICIHEEHDSAESGGVTALVTREDLIRLGKILSTAQPID